jgi:hypothetical protein
MALQFPPNPASGQTYFNWKWDGVKWTRMSEAGAAAGVSSFNTRTGAVTLASTDVASAGGALLADPDFTGSPTCPTPAPGDNSTNIATTAFVGAAIAATPPAGVSSFNTRAGAVTLTTADVTAAGGALLASPALTGNPTAPTAAAGDNDTSIATTAFVATSFAPLNSPTFTGAPAAPTVAAADISTKIATTAWVQQQFGTVSGRQNRNRIINGGFLIDQRNNGASITPANNQYVADRWAFTATLTNKFSSQISAFNAALPPGLGGSLLMTSSAATTPSSTDYMAIIQRIEFVHAPDFQWGRANASPAALSFWAFSATAGTYSGSIGNADGTRSYPFSFVLPSNVWTYFSFNIPGETTGVWYTAGNAVTMIVHFDLGAGATLRGPANAWASANYTGVTGSANACSAIGRNFAVSNVQFEMGTQSTPFDLRPFGAEFALCQRYYNVFPYAVGGYAAAGAISPCSGSFSFPQMRASPTYAPIGSITYSNASAFTATVQGPETFYPGVTVTATGSWLASLTASLNAEL